MTLEEMDRLAFLKKNPDISTKEEYQKSVEAMMKEFQVQITGLSKEVAAYREHNEKLVRENTFLRNQLDLKNKTRKLRVI